MGSCAEVRGIFQELVLSFHPMGPWDAFTHRAILLALKPLVDCMLVYIENAKESPDTRFLEFK